MPAPFLPDHISLLKQAMIPRAPGCLFTAADIAALGQQTGLNEAQLRKWADHLRSRVKAEDRLEHLRHVQQPEDESMNNAKRFYVTAFNVDEAFLKTFTLPKGRNQGKGAVFEIKYLDASIDGVSFAAEFFIEFASLIWQHRLAKRLEELGAGSVHIDMFENNDMDRSAAYALARVWSCASKTSSYTHGVCTPRLLSRAQGEYNHLQSSAMRERIAHDGDFFELDVVKKRRRMMEASIADTYDPCPDALARFEDFEQHTLPALLAVHADDLEHRAKEAAELEDDIFSGKAPSVGGVYFARSSAIKALKIGATRRPEPWARLKELSRCVPAPFELVAWVPTDRPFKLERSAHVHFAESRILTRGACTEFFSIDDAAATAFASTLV